MNQKSYFLAFMILATSWVTQAQQLSTEHLSGLKLRNIGPANMSGRIVDLDVVESDPYTFYIATATGGVWKTTNNGIVFKPVFENEATHSVGDIVIDQQNPETIWVGTGERANRQSSSWGDGVYKSTDGGQNWTNMGLNDSRHIGRIVVHPENSDVVFVAAIGHLWGPNNERGLYKSTDGGETWERKIYVDDITGVIDVAIDPDQPNIMYAATYQRMRKPFGFDGGGPGSGLHKSTDGGETWSEITEGLPEGDKGRIGISIYRTNPDIVYISVEQGFQYNASTAYGERRAGIYRSEDKGKTWTFMSDWNPRPMYASQILVDPSDDQRIYMMNRYSWSDDGGKTFTSPRQSLHGDDRFFWVNPEDSRHVMKADDGGLGISYDRGKTFLFQTALPISQFYRVSVDMKHPYHVYGGLQDNGSWYGPNQTYRAEGILNQDWKRSGGGDGFLNLVHNEDQSILFGESQYLGLYKMDMDTRQAQTIRPGDPKGHISPRRNWDAWGPNVPEPELGNAMEPANWDGPFYLSKHDNNTIYAGTNILYKSTDLGQSWTALGDLTKKMNRRELSIMGQYPDSLTNSLDDGIPYWPTLTAIAESPLKQGLLYVGTDDGNVQVSTDDGKTWEEVSDKLPGLPESTLINTIEVSQFDANTAYYAINNYRNDDYANYVYKTIDAGNTWTSIAGDLPADRVVRVVREDPKNKNLLYLGTEFGLFVSFNGGTNWVELKNNMPTLPFNDLVIHPRDNDLILGTHGRGVWILDNLSALQGMSSDLASSEAAIFEIPAAEMINYSRDGAHVGDMIFKGENPPKGSIIDYYLQTATAKSNVSLSILAQDGSLIRKLKTDTVGGLNRVVWDFKHEDFPKQSKNPADTNQRANWWDRALKGPKVAPGKYTARLTVNGTNYDQSLEVMADPRLKTSSSERAEWTANLLKIKDLYARVLKDVEVVSPIQWKVEALKKNGKSLNAAAVAQVKKTDDRTDELFNRISNLYREVSSWTGNMTEDQTIQMQYYTEMSGTITNERQVLISTTLKTLNKGLSKKDRITVD